MEELRHSSDPLAAKKGRGNKREREGKEEGVTGDVPRRKFGDMTNGDNYLQVNSQHSVVSALLLINDGQHLHTAECRQRLADIIWHIEAYETLHYLINKTFVDFYNISHVLC